MAESYTVEQGDTLASIAHAHGFLSWQSIWEHASNASLRDKRADPHVLAPGDVVEIPDKTIKEFECATKKLHTFKLKKPTLHFEQILLDDTDAPYSGKDYELKAGGEVMKGKTDNDGRVSEEIPFDADTVELTIWPISGDDSSAMSWTLDMGHLDPIDTVAGVQARLKNLGYDCDVNGEEDDKTKAAVSAFQTDEKLEVTGTIDDATRTRLSEKHD